MKHINVRVYGILIQDNQYGEGTKECLMREFKEELNLNIEIVSHFYTTDFFVNSAFSNQSQIISVYYLVKPLGELDFSISTTVFDFNEVKEGAQSMRWIEIDKVSENDFTFIIDKHVADLLEK